jgi:hypothetical protein
MSFDFPNTPANGDRYTPAGGPTYVFSNGVWLQSATPIATRTANNPNKVVNGDFFLSQQNGTTAMTAFGSYPADQWVVGGANLSPSSQLGIGGDMTPFGTRNVMVNSLTVAKASLAAGDLFGLFTRIEGYRVADLMWGTAQAIPAVLRFNAKCDTPGSYGVALRNANPATTCYTKLFNVTAAWQTIVLPIPPITSGTWSVDNTLGLEIYFTFASGSTYTSAAEGWSSGNFVTAPGQTNLAAATAKYFRISDVGLYPDPTNSGIAPPWQYANPSETWALCQRYYWNMPIGGAGFVGFGRNQGDTLRMFWVNFPVPMRTAPSMIYTGVLNYAGGSLGMTANGTTAQGAGCYYDTGNATYSFYMNQFTANARL